MIVVFKYFQPVYREAGFGLAQYEGTTIHMSAIK